jgi:hypothetical protein
MRTLLVCTTLRGFSYCSRLDEDDSGHSSIWRNLHPIRTVGGEHLRPLHLDNILRNPFDTTIAACYLIFGAGSNPIPSW